TPAYGLRVKTALQSGSHPLDTKLVPEVQSSIATAQLAPQAALFDEIALNHSLSASEISALMDGSAAIYLFGEIEYLDIYHNTHWTTFRMRRAVQMASRRMTVSATTRKATTRIATSGSGVRPWI